MDNMESNAAFEEAMAAKAAASEAAFAAASAAYFAANPAVRWRLSA